MNFATGVGPLDKAQKTFACCAIVLAGSSCRTLLGASERCILGEATLRHSDTIPSTFLVASAALGNDSSRIYLSPDSKLIMYSSPRGQRIDSIPGVGGPVIGIRSRSDGVVEVLRRDPFAIQLLPTDGRGKVGTTDLTSAEVSPGNPLFATYHDSLGWVLVSLNDNSDERSRDSLTISRVIDRGAPTLLQRLSTVPLPNVRSPRLLTGTLAGEELLLVWRERPTSIWSVPLGRKDQKTIELVLPDSIKLGSAKAVAVSIVAIGHGFILSFADPTTGSVWNTGIARHKGSAGYQVSSLHRGLSVLAAQRLLPERILALGVGTQTLGLEFNWGPCSPSQSERRKE